MRTALLSLFLFIGISFLHAQTAKQQHQIDSLTQELAKEELTDSLRNYTKLALADVYVRIKPDTAILIAQEVFDISANWLGMQAKAKWILGRAYSYQSDLIESIKQLKEGIELAQKGNDTIALARCMHSLGSAFMEKGEYAPAIEYLFKALKSYELLGEDRRAALVNNDLGLIFHEQQLYEKSKKHHEINLKIGEKLQDVFLQLIANNNIGLVYEVEEDYKQSLVHFQKALELNKEYGDKPGNSLILCNIAECHLNLKEYDKGIAFGLRSLEEAKAVDYGRVIARANSVLGALYTAKGNAKEAIRRLEKSLAISRKAEHNKEVLTSLLYIHEAYYQNKQFAKAYDAYYEFVNLKDSLSNLTEAKKLIQKEGEYKDEMHRLEQEKNELAHQAELDQQRVVRNSFIGGFAMMLVLAYVMFRSAQAKKKANTILKEQKNEITLQNEELQQQSEEIMAQRDAIEESNHKLNQRNQQVTQSIEAAKLIQHAMIPFDSRVKQLVKDYFVLYQPKDIVSGDFYWIDKVGEVTIAAVVDCTGHGVPGAFMSMIGNIALDEIVRLNQVTDPAEILSELNKLIIHALHQEEGTDINGMDVAVIALSQEKNGMIDIQFAGAKRPLYYFCSNTQQMKVVHGTKKSIGGRQNQKEFENQHLSLPVGSMVYLCSDGLEDQHNSQNRKIGRATLLEKLEAILSVPTTQQKEHLETYLDNYKQGVHQRDDILLMGIQL